MNVKGTEVGKEELLIGGCVAQGVSTNADDVMSWDCPMKGHINCNSEGEVFTFLVSHCLKVCSTDLTLRKSQTVLLWALSKTTHTLMPARASLGLVRDTVLK